MLIKSKKYILDLLNKIFILLLVNFVFAFNNIIRKIIYI